MPPENNKSIILASGQSMPAVGLGTWGLAGDTLRRVLKISLEYGYRHIDTAAMHCNEVEIGEVIREWIEHKKLKRGDVFITSKLPPNGMHADKVKHFCQLSLDKLSLTHIDLYLIQLPFGTRYVGDEEFFPPDPEGNFSTDVSGDIAKIWAAMEQLVEEGMVKNIGVSNFSQDQLDKLLKVVKIKPSNLQIEVNPYFQQKKLRKFCRENGISVTAYCPLGSANRESYLHCNNESERRILKMLHDPMLVEMGEKCIRSPAQIALRHMTQKNIAVIPSSKNHMHLKENIDIFDFYLTPSEMRQLDTLDVGQYGRSFDYSFVGESLLWHPEYPFAVVDDSKEPGH